MIIIETCPKCGHDLMDEVICTYPPIPRKSCPSCGWNWEGEPEQVIRIPFGGNSFNYDETYTLHGNTDYECVSGLATSTSTCGDNAISMSEATDALIKAFKDFEDGFINGTISFKKPSCANCPNNTKNGGSGICHCILGQLDIT